MMSVLGSHILRVGVESGVSFGVNVNTSSLICPFFNFVAVGEKEPSPAPGTFGHLLAQSGLTEDALDSLIALKDFTGIEGLPPLELIEEMDPERERKAMRREIERRKQEEIDKTRVKTVDEFGRAYATGKRKESIARVWLSQGEGKFFINGKAFDYYFPDIANRVHMLEPFVQTNTIGAFDVRSTVKGGGTTGQASRFGVDLLGLGFQDLYVNFCPFSVLLHIST